VLDVHRVEDGGELVAAELLVDSFGNEGAGMG
jgi:hypothetical protein